ncbi:hypothetical protein Huta_2073 [Halorhabdus utahensis DSM 12940]|uniref:Uncharacterized protein n=1 Tax=Halorhabdus utahensis (strain DSM 12940 / JCM 11049 / AX-2) TaxID=519442 RepID=C7NTZ5_HALUD|nr:hypothetical protein [Halorhabdus utahensis]ACV12240.1 hypothetical protein Huta_2073 [Halorhabdus utahensis DSM 12940]
MQEDDPFLKLLKDSFATAKDGAAKLNRSQTDSLPCRGSLAELIHSDEYESPYAGPVEGDAEAEIREVKGVVRLVIDPASIDYEKRVAMSDSMDSVLEEAQGFPLAPASGIAEAVKGKEGKEFVDEIVSFYRGKVPPRFRQPLIQGMALRIAEDNNPMEQWEVRKRKREAAKAHEKRGYSRPEAYNTASLCSSGYFDPDRLFQRLYQDQVEFGGWSDGDYANAFEELVVDKPFVVFVKSGMSYKEAYHAMIGKSLDIDEYIAPLNYIDIRGKGQQAEETVEKAAEYINQHHNSVKIKPEHENGQSNLRVWYETL